MVPRVLGFHQKLGWAKCEFVWPIRSLSCLHSKKLVTKVVNKSCEQKFWTKVVNKSCIQVLWTRVVYESCKQRLWASFFLTRVVYESWKQEVWAKIVIRICEKKLRTKIIMHKNQKLWGKSFNNSFKQELCKKVINKSCKQKLWTKVVKKIITKVVNTNHQQKLWTSWGWVVPSSEVEWKLSWGSIELN